MSMVKMKINLKNIFVFILNYLDNGYSGHIINKPYGWFCMSEDARMPGCQDARMPGCQDARMPGCQDARMPVPPGSGGTRLPGGHAEAVDSDIRFKFKRDRNVK